MSGAKEEPSFGGASEIFYSAVVDSNVKGFDDGLSTVSLGDLGSIPLVLGGQTSRAGNNGGWLRVESATSTSATRQGA